MTWVYLDDGFYDGDKVSMAGGDAGWLYVCALSYCRRKHNGGIFPKSIVGQFSDRKNPAGLARKLVQVELWEEIGDHYSIHDYEHWNKLAEDERKRRSDKARRAALARWHGKPKPDAQALPEHCSPDAPGDAQPMPSPNTPSGVRQSSTHVGSDAQPMPPTTTDDLLNQAWEILAERDRKAKYAETGQHPRNPTAWLASAASRRRSQHEADARRILATEDMTATQLADMLEPPAPGPARPKAYGTEPDCVECGGTGWLDDGADKVLPCACRAAS